MQYIHVSYIRCRDFTPSQDCIVEKRKNCEEVDLSQYLNIRNWLKLEDGVASLSYFLLGTIMHQNMSSKRATSWIA